MGQHHQQRFSASSNHLIDGISPSCTVLKLRSLSLCSTSLVVFDSEYIFDRYRWSCCVISGFLQQYNVRVPSFNRRDYPPFTAPRPSHTPLPYDATHMTDIGQCLSRNISCKYFHTSLPRCHPSYARSVVTAWHHRNPRHITDLRPPTQTASLLYHSSQPSSSPSRLMPTTCQEEEGKRKHNIIMAGTFGLWVSVMIEVSTKSNLRSCLEQ